MCATSADARLEIDDALSGGTTEAQRPPTSVRWRRISLGWSVAAAVIATVDHPYGVGSHRSTDA